VRDDPVTLLERELVDAARRQAVITDAREGSSHEPRGPWPTLRPARRRRSLGSFAAVVLSGLAVVVALGALLALHGHKPPARPAPAARQVVPGRRQLIDIIGVLRRPQTKADLNPRILSQLSGVPLIALEGTVDRSLVRFAATTPWGEKLYLVPYRPPTAAEIAAIKRRFPGASLGPITRGETLGVMSVGGGGGGVNAAGVQAGDEMQMDGAGRSFAGGSTQTRYILVVPDRVARVEFYFPPRAVPAGGPVYRHSLAVTVPVHGNIAAVQVTQQCCAGQPALIWYGARGQVIKQIGSLKPPPPPPQPAPETALSRAAERNPATPNRVWAAPVTGGPTTAVRIQFRLLLNDVDYQFRGTGPGGAGCQSSFGGVAGGGVGDVRGRIFSDAFAPAPGRHWCPGTYMVTVAAYDRGRAGTLHAAPRPFGTATFKVSG
jgi:hypothetical protein